MYILITNIYAYLFALLILEEEIRRPTEFSKKKVPYIFHFAYPPMNTILRWEIGVIGIQTSIKAYS